MYESAFPPIGEIGATICSRCEQLSRMISNASSTCSSSQPIINVVLPSFKTPPDVANFVALQLFSFQASIKRLVSLSCTTAMINFTFITPFQNYFLNDVKFYLMTVESHDQ